MDPLWKGVSVFLGRVIDELCPDGSNLEVHGAEGANTWAPSLRMGRYLTREVRGSTEAGSNGSGD